MKITKACFNPIYLPFLNAQERVQIFYGGSSSGKSFYLAQRCIIDVVSKGRNYLICRNVGATLKKSTFNELNKCISFFKLKNLFSINQTDMTITCLLNNAQIMFSGLDDPEKIKSITPLKGVLTDVWVEEATETDYNAVKQLQKRLRGKSNHNKRIILSFNPILQSHWIYKEFFKDWDDNKKLYRTKDLLILKTTYKDNKHLTKDDIYALENEKDEYFYNVYSLGLWGVLGAVIYRNWRVEDLTERIPSFDNYKIGLDFGFADHPSALVITHYDKNRKKIYVIDELYVKGMDNEDLAKVVLDKIGKKVVVCDSAEPKSIAELKKYGVYAVGAKKGVDSVDYGIKFIQKHEIIIDKKCLTFIDEISKYQWKKDKYGNVLPVPIKEEDHGMDGLRYAYEDEMQMSEGIIFT